MKIAALVLAVLALTAAAASATPVITPKVFGTPGANGWYRSNVIVNWDVTDDHGWPLVSETGCGPTTLTNDTPPSGVKLTCEAASQNPAAPSVPQPPSARSVGVFIDRVAPTSVVARASRAPDSGLWFNKPVTVTWSAIDAGSGVAACTSVTFAGPFLAGGPLTGTCTDRAGNVSAAVPFALDYDSVPPTIGALAATPNVGRATLAWQATGASTYTLRRRTAGRPRSTRVVYSGAIPSFTDGGLRVGRRYTFTLTATDPAGNAATASIRVALTKLVSPAAGASMTLPPLLRWNRAPRADYYNVQLFRNGHKILSIWPRHHRLQLKQRWRFGGRTHRLRPGTYRWFVWPGIGPRSRNHYGKLLGTRTFTVVKT